MTAAYIAPPADVLPTAPRPPLPPVAVPPQAQSLREWVLSPAERAVLYASTPGATAWLPQLEALGHCESSHSPGAIGDGGASRGWFQVQRLWFDRIGEDWEQAYDPAVNLRVALTVIAYDIATGQHPFAQWRRCSEVLP